MSDADVTADSGVTNGSGYRPFPSASQWPTGGMEFAPVDDLLSVVESLRSAGSGVWEKAVEVVRSAAAIETGAIEKLYDLDRGLTITAAVEGAVLEQVLRGEDEKTRALIASQLKAYDYVLDLVTGQRPIAASWIRELHAVLCANQDTYRVLQPDRAFRDEPLPKGRYKERDNHVQLGEGAVHYYCPALSTQQEMDRLIDNIAGSDFACLHAVDQAAYLHYALVAIHPFADGNGRVARALASVPAYRVFRVPLLITADQREPYFDALEAADRGDFGQFRLFMRNRVVDSILLLQQSVAAAKLGSPEEAIASAGRNFVTRGGYSHVALDEAAIDVLRALEREMKLFSDNPATRHPGLTFGVALQPAQRALEGSSHRRTLSVDPHFVHFGATAKGPADANWTLLVGVAVPRDAGADDSLVLECGEAAPDLRCEIAVRNVLPKRMLLADIAIKTFARQVFARMVQYLDENGREAMKRRGY